MEIAGGPGALLAVMNLLNGGGGKAAAPAVVQLEWLPGHLQIKYLNSAKSVYFCTKVVVDSVSGPDASPCFVYVKDLVNALSCWGSFDTRTEIAFDESDAVLRLSACEGDGSRIGFEIHTIESEFVDRIELASLTSMSEIKVVIESEILATAFLQCHDSAVDYLHLSFQVGDFSTPLISMRSQIVGGCDTEVAVGVQLATAVEGTGHIEMLINGKDVGGIVQFLATVGSARTDVVVTHGGLRMCRKLITSNDAELVVVGGIVNN